MFRLRGWALGLILSVASSTLSAVVIDPGLYQLHNHPDGLAAPPDYGLRLDELFDVSASLDVFTFEFDAPGASMWMDYNGTSMHIYGTVYGGLNENGDYSHSPDYVGFWDVDFTYSIGLGLAPGDDDLAVLDPGGNSGTLTRSSDNYVINLTDKSNGSYTFRLGDESDNMGHRGYAGISGWGWLMHENMGSNPTADFLFTAVQVPEPHTYMTLGAFMAMALLYRRRRAHSQA